MLQITKTRLPFSREWDWLGDAVNWNNDVMHWEGVWTLCQDKAPLFPSCRKMRGAASRKAGSTCSADCRYDNIGFRPVFEVKTDHPDGAIVTVGTLYLDEKPVKVPTNPVWNGDIPSYHVQHSSNPHQPAPMELQEALNNPAYQVQTIKIGNFLIADRVLIRGISVDDLHALGFC